MWFNCTFTFGIAILSLLNFINGMNLYLSGWHSNDTLFIRYNRKIFECLSYRYIVAIIYLVWLWLRGGFLHAYFIICFCMLHILPNMLVFSPSKFDFISICNKSLGFLLSNFGSIFAVISWSFWPLPIMCFLIWSVIVITTLFFVCLLHFLG